MKVSVIMSTYNESIKEIDSCVNSILNQTYNNFNFFIAVDDPNRKDIISYLKNIEKKDNRVNVFVNRENIGLVKSLNMLINKADGEFIFRMDADDISNKYRFEKQLKFMIDNSLDISATLVNFIDSDDFIIGKMKYIKYNYINNELKNIMKYRNIMPHTTWCVKKHVYKTLDGYRELSPAEDYDFLLRAIENDNNVGLINEFLASHRIRENSISLSNKISQYAMASSLRDNFGNLNYISTEELLNYKQNVENRFSRFFHIESLKSDSKIIFLKKLKMIFYKDMFILKLRSLMYVTSIVYYNFKNQTKNFFNRII